ncbi:hypothetical protein ACUNV4_29395 [Granulosicoccus sp. 3-233]|uniref:hypothetical protein n=1 Tax=Granulosicoccus sp. 3-233 TaxID=3417969 RepID=UPI003D3565C1
MSEGDLVDREGKNQLIPHDIGVLQGVDDEPFRLQIPGKGSVFLRFLQRRNVDAQRKLFEAVAEAGEAYIAAAKVGNRIQGKNLRAILDADSDLIHASRITASRALDSERFEKEQDSIRQETLAAQNKLAQLKAQDALREYEKNKGKTKKDLLKEQTKKKLQARREARRAYIKEQQEIQEVIKEIDEMCEEKVAEFYARIRRQGREPDLSEGSQDFLNLQQIEDSYEMMKQGIHSV